MNRRGQSATLKYLLFVELCERKQDILDKKGSFFAILSQTFSRKSFLVLNERNRALCLPICLLSTLFSYNQNNESYCETPDGSG